MTARRAHGLGGKLKANLMRRLTSPEQETAVQAEFPCPIQSAVVTVWPEATEGTVECDRFKARNVEFYEQCPGLWDRNRAARLSLMVRPQETCNLREA